MHLFGQLILTLIAGLAIMWAVRKLQLPDRLQGMELLTSILLGLISIVIGAGLLFFAFTNRRDNESARYRDSRKRTGR